MTLSHYCPTARELLEAPSGAIRVMTDAPGFPPGAEYVGLTADQALPPLLHPRLAMDWESWWLFESQAISLIDNAPDPLARLALAVEHMRRWTVDAGPLRGWVSDAFVRARNASDTPIAPDASQISAHRATALSAVPKMWRAAASEALVASQAPVSEQVWRRYLSAHAFANWAAYQGEGLRTWYRAIETAACLLRQTADPGSADLVLRHLADTPTLLAVWMEAERAPVT